jgi:hypothetical protein
LSPIFAQAENGHPQFWKEKFHAILMDPEFFFLSAWVERGF